MRITQCEKQIEPGKKVTRGVELRAHANTKVRNKQ